VPKQLFRNAALTIACLLMTTGAGWAQQSYSSRVAAASYTSYQSQPASPVIGKYTSEAFYPSPLVLNVTGMDQYGNLSGSLWGMSTKPQNGWDPAWEYWQKVFGRNAQAVYRNGQVLITFDNGATYKLNVSGMELRGQFEAKDEHRDVTFLKASSVAAR
jgi:hypothetical protein